MEKGDGGGLSGFKVFIHVFLSVWLSMSVYLSVTAVVCLTVWAVQGLDEDANFIHNHLVLDQTIDLRNDLMKVVYPFGEVKTKDQFPEGAKKHMAGTATTNFKKLEGICKGPFMCGAKPQSGDFVLWEMLDQHHAICLSIGEPSILDAFPKLKALHAALKAEPALAKYFAADMYASWAQNNGLFTHFTGQPEGFVYGGTITEEVTF